MGYTQKLAWERQELGTRGEVEGGDEAEEWNEKEKKYSGCIRGDDGGRGEEEEVIYELCINTRARRVR